MFRVNCTGKQGGWKKDARSYNVPRLGIKMWNTFFRENANPL